MIRTAWTVAFFALAAAPATAQPAKLEPIVLPAPAAPGPDVKPYVKASAAKLALTHVTVIDGTGSPPVADRTIVIVGGRIVSVGADAPPADATALDLSGRTVLPGIVGMHDHMFSTSADRTWMRSCTATRRC